MWLHKGSVKDPGNIFLSSLETASFRFYTAAIGLKLVLHVGYLSLKSQ